MLTYKRGTGWVEAAETKSLNRRQYEGVFHYPKCVRCNAPDGQHNYNGKYHGLVWDDDLICCADGEPGEFDVNL